MGKGNGTTRASASNSPKGLTASERTVLTTGQADRDLRKIDALARPSTYSTTGIDLSNGIRVTIRRTDVTPDTKAYVVEAYRGGNRIDTDTYQFLVNDRGRGPLKSSEEIAWDDSRELIKAYAKRR